MENLCESKCYGNDDFVLPALQLNCQIVNENNKNQFKLLFFDDMMINYLNELHYWKKNNNISLTAEQLFTFVELGIEGKIHLWNTIRVEDYINNQYTIIQHGGTYNNEIFHCNVVINFI